MICINNLQFCMSTAALLSQYQLEYDQISIPLGMDFSVP